MRCPKCGSQELETITDEFTTGVVAPDGYREIGWAEIVRCQGCGNEYDYDDNSILSEAEREAA